MGKILKSMLQDKLDLDIGFRLFSVIDKAYIEDLKLLNYRHGDKSNRDTTNKWIYKWNKIVEESLNNLGLLYPVIGDNSYEREYFGRSNVEYNIKDYKISSLGQDLVEHGF